MSTHSRQIWEAAESELRSQLSAAIYRASAAESRAEQAERERDEAERLLERVAGEVDDVLAGIPVYLADEIAALMRARQERVKGGGDG